MKLTIKTISEFETYLREAAEAEIKNNNAFLDSSMDKFINKVKTEVGSVTDFDYTELNHCEDGKVDFEKVDIVTINIDFKTYWVKLIANLVTKEISIGSVEL